jgi:hypothetical protein
MDNLRVVASVMHSAVLAALAVATHDDSVPTRQSELGDVVCADLLPPDNVVYQHCTPLIRDARVSAASVAERCARRANAATAVAKDLILGWADKMIDLSAAAAARDEHAP